jgi:hypothetical protein
VHTITIIAFLKRNCVLIDIVLFPPLEIRISGRDDLYATCSSVYYCPGNLSILVDFATGDPSMDTSS